SRPCLRRPLRPLPCSHPVAALPSTASGGPAFHPPLVSTRPALPRRPTEPRRPAEPRRTTEPRCSSTASTATAATVAPTATAATAAMASPTVLTFDAEGRTVDFDVWVDDLQLFLQCDSRDGVSLFDHTSGVSTAPTATSDSTLRSQWTTRDAVAHLAVRSHLLPAERAHFGQYKTAQSLHDAVVARYSSPATAALSRLMLLYLFPGLAAFAIVADLITHLRTSDARYRAALPTEDHFLSLCPTELVYLLEERLAAAEKSILAVGAPRGDRCTPFFEGCSPVSLLPSIAFAAAVNLVGTEKVGTASAPSGRRRNSKGKGSKGGGGDGGGGGGGGGGGRGGGGGGGGGGRIGIFSGGTGGGGGSGGGGGGSGSGGGGSSSGGGGGGGGGAGRGATAQRGGFGGGQCQQQPRSRETPSAEQLREWYTGRGRSGGAGPWGDLPLWGDLLRQNVAIFYLDFDAILAAMYALSDSAEGDCYLSVLPDPGIKAAALGASASAAPGTGESAALGTGKSALSGTAPTEALHTFTLDSGASRSYFRDSTTLTRLSRPVAVSLADPSGGPVLAHSSAVLPCLAAPSGLLSGLHLPSFSTNLVSGADLQDACVDQFTPGGQRVTHCTCSQTGRHMATFTRRPGSSLYTLTTASPPVTASSQVFGAATSSNHASAPCSCRPLSHETLLWHHRLGHPSLPRLQGMASCTLVSGLPRSLPPLPPRPAPTCVPCVEGRKRTAPHSSTFPPMEAPLQTIHMDVWGPARVRGHGHERYFLLVVEDYSRYTTIFTFRSTGDVTKVLIDWIHGARRQLSESFGSDLPVLRVHSDRGGEFSSDLLRAFCGAEGIRQTFTLPASPQQNGIAERRIGMVMDVACTSMIHAAAPHFLWPFVVQYAAHQINLQPRVSLPETTPTLRLTEKVGDASVFRVWGFELLSAILQRTSCPPMPFLASSLASPLTHPGGSSTTPPRVVFSQDVTFDESESYYRLFPYRTASPPPSATLPSTRYSSDPTEPEEVAIDSGAAGGAERERVEPGGAESWGAESGRAEPGGAEPERLEPRGTASGGIEPARAEFGGSLGAAGTAGGAAGAAGGAAGAVGGATGAGPAGGATRARAAGVARGAAGAAGGAAGAAGGAAGAGAASGTLVVGGSGGSGAARGSGAAGSRGARTGGTGAAGASGATGVRAAGAGAVATRGAYGAGAAGGTGAGGAAGVVAGDPGAEGTGAVFAVSGGAARPRPYYVPLLQQPASPLPGPSPYSGPTRGLTERCEPESRLASPESRSDSPVRTVHAGRRVSRPRPPPVPGTHSMTLHPSTAPQLVPLPSPPASSLLDGPDPESDSLCAASPTVLRFLATALTDPLFESTGVSALVAELVDFAAACRLDYATSLVAEFASASICPPSVRGECALGTDVLEDRQEEFECFAVAVPHLVSMLLALEGDPDAPDIPTLRSYAEAIEDDLVFATADTEALAHVKSELQKRHTCTNLGELTSYLGLRITRDRAQRTITLTQSHMVQQVLQRFGFTYSSPQSTPLPTSHSLSPPPLDESVEPSGPYPELVGCLIYLMTCIRPELAYPLSLVAHYVAPGRHRKVHWDAAKRVLRYLCSTSGMGLVLGGRARVVLTGHADASWVDDLATQRSSQGYTFSLGSGSVSWRSTRSSSVLSSSCEAEIYAGAMAAQELRWLTYLLTNLGEAPCSPPILNVDNKAMLALCQEHSLEHRMKHIALRYFLARELQQRGQLRLAYVASQAKTADVFTKALQPCDHQRFCTVLGLVVFTILLRGDFVIHPELAMPFLTGLVTTCSPPLCLWGSSSQDSFTIGRPSASKVSKVAVAMVRSGPQRQRRRHSVRVATVALAAADAVAAASAVAVAAAAVAVAVVVVAAIAAAVIAAVAAVAVVVAPAAAAGSRGAAATAAVAAAAVAVAVAATPVVAVTVAGQQCAGQLRARHQGAG
ncbi:unnamed protein product, partial [Closterium sp. NIES-54]